MELLHVRQTCWHLERTMASSLWKIKETSSGMRNARSLAVPGSIAEKARLNTVLACAMLFLGTGGCY
jgi:hypothetical protein